MQVHEVLARQVALDRVGFLVAVASPAEAAAEAAEAAGKLYEHVGCYSAVLKYAIYGVYSGVCLVLPCFALRGDAASN